MYSLSLLPGEGTVIHSHGGAPKIARTPHLDKWRSLSLAVDEGEEKKAFEPLKVRSLNGG